jgi:hypothetical protein
MEACGLARWDGAAWSSLGSGVRREPGLGISLPTVFALGISGDDVYVAGNFHYAGERFSGQFGRWNEHRTFTAPGLVCVDSPVGSPGNPFQCRVTASSGVGYVVEASTNLADWLPLATNTASPLLLTDTNAAGHPQRFYRGRKLN